MEIITFGFDSNGYLRLNVKSFRRKDRSTKAAKFMKFNITPLLQAVEEREKSLFQNEIEELDEHRKNICDVRAKLEGMHSDYISKHDYVKTNNKLSSNSEIIEAMKYAEKLYAAFDKTIDNAVSVVEKIKSHVKHTKKTLLLGDGIYDSELEEKLCEELDKEIEEDEWLDYARCLTEIDIDLQIEQSEEPFYDKYTNGAVSALKKKILAYYSSKKASDEMWLHILRLLLMITPIGLLIMIFWQIDEYNENETKKDFDKAICQKISMMRARYLFDIYKSADNKCNEIVAQMKDLAHIVGAIFSETLCFLPNEYRTIEDCKNLHRILKEGYAENLREAYMVYENEKLRGKQEELEQQRKNQMIAMLNVVQASVNTVAAASKAAYNASEMAITAQEKLIDARRDTEEANKRIAVAEKKNAENKAALDKIKRDVKDLKDNN